MENLYEKPKPGQKLEASSAYPEVKAIDNTKDIIDASVNPKIDPKDLSKELKFPLYPEVPKPKKEELNNLYSKVELKPELLKGKNVNSTIDKQEPITKIGEINNEVKNPIKDTLKSVNPILASVKPITDLGNVNPSKTK